MTTPPVISDPLPVDLVDAFDVALHAAVKQQGIDMSDEFRSCSPRQQNMVLSSVSELGMELFGLEDITSLIVESFLDCGSCYTSVRSVLEVLDECGVIELSDAAFLSIL